MTITLPVHPVSKKIILVEYGRKPGAAIKIKKNHLLLQQLLYADHNPNIAYLNELLTTSIEIKLGQNYAHRVGRNKAAGYHIYKFHLNMMLHFMLGQVMGGLPAYPAMLQWYDMYGIDDNDMSFDAAYKRWQRWSETKKYVKHWRKLTHNVHSDANKRGGLKRPAEDVLEAAANYLASVLDECFNTREDLSVNMIRRALIYIFRDYGCWHNAEIARKFGLKENTIRHHVSRFQGILDTEPALAAPYEAIVQ